MNLKSYYYNCFPDYIASIDPDLHSEVDFTVHGRNAITKKSMVRSDG
jgi:hypothetical protein